MQNCAIALVCRRGMETETHGVGRPVGVVVAEDGFKECAGVDERGARPGLLLDDCGRC
jgi:hypothetical protein